MPSARPRGMIVALCTGSVALDVQRHDGVAAFMIGGEPFLLLGHDHGAAFGAHHDLVLRIFEFGHRHDALAAPRREQGGLVHEIDEIGAGKAGRPARDRSVHKATIIPRGRALGMVMQLPERDKLSTSYAQMTSRLAVCMGGRVAEEIIFGKDQITSGAQSDIEQATKLARAMVTRWGFSDELGTVMYGENQEEVFLGYSMGKQQTISEETARKIDSEVRRLVELGLSEAKRILTEKRQDLEALRKGLLEYETLSGDEIIGLLQGRRPVRENPRTRRRCAARPCRRRGASLRPKPGPEPGGLEPQPQA